MPMNEGALMFYANDEQQRQLKEADLTLPDGGFEFVDLEAGDAEAIANEIISLKSAREVEIIAYVFKLYFHW
jgi:hypothetical protein